LHPFGVAKSSTSFGWGKGGEVTSAGWQVTLCDPIWQVISRSGVGIYTNCYTLTFTFLKSTTLLLSPHLPRKGGATPQSCQAYFSISNGFWLDYEPVVTDGTLETLLSAVCPHVQPQVLRAAKHLPAQRTLVRLFTRVNSEVPRQVAHTRERLGADGTVERFLARMTAIVDR